MMILIQMNFHSRNSTNYTIKYVHVQTSKIYSNLCKYYHVLFVLLICSKIFRQFLHNHILFLLILAIHGDGDNNNINNNNNNVITAPNSVTDIFKYLSTTVYYSLKLNVNEENNFTANFVYASTFMKPDSYILCEC
ncbi:unnamed protein product [Trichobilharzia regenti]|nr:unnamed protein product [Trichobilharzia regenti]